MAAPRIVTTSWDDGDPLDLKVAELLRARGLPGTIYFPFRGHHGRQTLSPDHVRSMVSEGFEVGGHGISHRVLPPLRSEAIAQEVGTCKNRLEDILGQQVRMFCYPKGRLNGSIVRHVKDAGYQGARTTRMLKRSLDFDPFRMPTTVAAYPNLRQMYAKNLIKGRNTRGLLDYVSHFIRADSWVSMGKVLFDRVLKEGGVWHLYGHSWQIEEMGLWDDLKEMLDYVCGRAGVHYVTNAEVLTFLPRKIPATTVRLHPTQLK
jgi:peptidoglycan/xylan/chitin deacetylase (PgdA/CDA1 family)